MKKKKQEKLKIAIEKYWSCGETLKATAILLNRSGFKTAHNKKWTASRLSCFTRAHMKELNWRRNTDRQIHIPLMPHEKMIGGVEVIEQEVKFKEPPYKLLILILLLLSVLVWGFYFVSIDIFSKVS